MLFLYLNFWQCDNQSVDKSFPSSNEEIGHSLGTAKVFKLLVTVFDKYPSLPRYNQELDHIKGPPVSDTREDTYNGEL